MTSTRYGVSPGRAAPRAPGGAVGFEDALVELAVDVVGLVAKAGHQTGISAVGLTTEDTENTEVSRRNANHS
jgi:hypothetical protein